MQKLDTSAPSSTFQFSFTIFFCKSRQILFLKRVENYTVNACNTQQFGFLKVWAETRCVLLLYSNHEMAPKVLFEAKLVFSCHTILSLLGHESDRVTHLDVWTRFHFNFSEKSWPETQLSNGGGVAVFVDVLIKLSIARPKSKWNKVMPQSCWW